MKPQVKPLKYASLANVQPRCCTPQAVSAELACSVMMELADQMLFLNARQFTPPRLPQSGLQTELFVCFLQRDIGRALAGYLWRQSLLQVCQSSEGTVPLTVS